MDPKSNTLMTKILCIETATDICSVAVSIDGVLASLVESNDQNSHSEKLTVFIEEALAKAGVPLTELSAVAVSMGPGSYTGLRIGVSTAKGFCFGLNIPLIAISTLQSIAWGAKKFMPKNTEVIIPMIDARRMEVYNAHYSSEILPINEVKATVIDDEYITQFDTSLNTLLCGNGAFKCVESMGGLPNITIVNSHCSAENMTVLAQQKFDCEEFESVPYFEPFYLKDYIAAQSYVKGLR